MDEEPTTPVDLRDVFTVRGAFARICLAIPREQYHTVFRDVVAVRAWMDLAHDVLNELTEKLDADDDGPTDDWPP